MVEAILVATWTENQALTTNLVLQLTVCAASGKLLNLFESQFPLLKWDSPGYLQVGKGN